ncbi:MAG: hypothetical protein GY809_05245 [Planctomycetes bacterium]|nr:hypothetical protein [Planctomycetota bacterium]
MRNFIYLALVVMLSCLVSWASAQEQWLRYRYSREATSMTVGGYQQLELIAEAPEGLAGPDLKGEHVIYAKWSTPMVKAGYLWLALGQSKANGPHDQLVIDADCDGVLDDNMAIKAHRVDSYSHFGPVKVVFKGEDGPVAYHLNLEYYARENYQRLYARPGGWYEGEVRIGHNRQYCTLVDQNVNGAFDDKALAYENADRISLAKEGVPDFRVVGQYVEFETGLFTLDVAQDGAFVEVKPAQDVAMGEVQLTNPVANIVVGGATGQFDRIPKDGKIFLPLGDYLIDQWTLEAKDKDQVAWTATATSRSEQSRFEVCASEPAKLRAGEPLVSTLTVNKNGTAYNFNQTLVAALGETVTLRRNGTQAPAPRLHIKDKPGTYDRTYSFAYG